jgi:putative nucleotidyltransferase with HDIG domain
MTVLEPSTPALPDRARQFRWGYFGTRLLYVLLLLGAAAALPGGSGVPSKYRYREGEIARERVVAPYDFRVEKDEAQLRLEQERAAGAVPPVFVRDSRAASDALARFASFEGRSLAILQDATVEPGVRASQLRGLGIPLTDESLGALAAPGRARRVLTGLGEWLTRIYDTGVVAEKRQGALLGHSSVNLRDGENELPVAASMLLDRREALQSIDERAHAAFTNDALSVKLANELATAFLAPNVVYDRAETEWRRVQAQGAVPTTLGHVQKEELIVDANQRVGRNELLELRSLRNIELAKRGHSEFLYPPVARMLLMLLFIAVFATYLRMELPGIYRDNAMLGMFTLLTALVVLLARVQTSLLGLSELMVPLALAPLVVASVLEKRPALVFTLLLTVVVMTVDELGAPFAAVAVMGGVTAVYSVSRLRHRWHFVRATFTVATANMAAIIAWDVAQSAGLRMLATDVLWGALGAFLSISLAFLLLPVVEHLFGLTSDITLLELSDLNRPLLKRLQLEAPGTYHHSMVVGSLAEAAAEAVGGNSLLARVQAYYHDIGKLGKPEYYAENEPAFSRSRHEKLAPSMSTLVVKSHITEGLELARKERLPKAVQAAIPEHHGTMVMAFFYHKALELDPTARREDFSYPGPKPRSRETAILMLADGVEGSSRALQEPTPSRIRGLVTRLIDERVSQSQLDDSPLTMQDLARIREAFIPVLTAIFHVRAPYPEAPRRRPDVESRREG